MDEFMKKTISFSYAGVPVITYALIGVTSVVLAVNLIMSDDEKQEENTILPGLGMIPQTVSNESPFGESSEPPISSPFDIPSETEEKEQQPDFYQRETEEDEKIPEERDENAFGGKLSKKSKKNSKKRTIQKKRKNNKKSRKNN